MPDSPISLLPANPAPSLSDLVAISKGSIKTYKTTMAEYAALIGAANISSYPAGEIIPSQRAVVLIGGQLFLFDPANPAHYKKTVGITKQAAGIIGTVIDVWTSGKADGFGGTLLADNIYYAGASGALTVTPTSTPGEFVQFLGFAIDANTMLINIDDNFQIA